MLQKYFLLDGESNEQSHYFIFWYFNCFKVTEKKDRNLLIVNLSLKSKH